MKFEFGDLVRVKHVLGSSKLNFPEGVLALVEGDYGELCGEKGESNYEEGGDNSYSLFVKGHGSISWYDEDDIKLVKKNQAHLFLKCDKRYMDDKVRFLVERIKYFK